MDLSRSGVQSLLTRAADAHLPVVSIMSSEAGQSVRSRIADLERSPLNPEGFGRRDFPDMLERWRDGQSPGHTMSRLFRPSQFPVVAVLLLSSASE